MHDSDFFFSVAVLPATPLYEVIIINKTHQECKKVL